MSDLLAYCHNIQNRGAKAFGLIASDCDREEQVGLEMLRQLGVTAPVLSKMALAARNPIPSNSQYTEWNKGYYAACRAVCQAMQNVLDEAESAK